MKKICTVLFLAFVESAAAGEKGPWEFSAGMGGTASLNTGSSAETFYWGPFMRADYEIIEPLKARLGARHTENKFLYDGLGNIAKQSNTGISPGLNWEITDTVTLDSEYSFRFGENDFREHAGILGVEYAGWNLVRFGLDGNYSQQNYNFPTSGTGIIQRSFGLSLESTFIASKQLEIPLLLTYLNSRYSTNKTIYTARTAALGVTWRTEDRKWSLSASGSVGSDSSNYSILGAEARVRFKPLEQVSIRFSAAISAYNYSAAQNSKSRIAQGDSVSPLGNSDAFNIQSAGIEAAYSF